MTETTLFYRLRIRNRADDADLLVLSSVPTDDNPYLTEFPSGDGQSIDAITGAGTSGDYTFKVADAEDDDGNRIVTSVLADVYARQQLLSLRAFGEISEDGETWDTIIPGYVLAVRLVTAIEYEIAIGATRRREVSKEIFREATTRFGNVTCVIGGPALEDFAGLLTDNGGWKFTVAGALSSPGYHLTLASSGGFDPRKDPSTHFSSTSTAIRDYTNNWARGYFIPATTWHADDVQGNFPGLIARVRPVGGTSVDDVFLVPLSVPVAPLGDRPWFADPRIDNLITSGTSSLYLPADDINGDPFSPSVSDQFYVWVYATQISEANPLHYYGHPVDLWEQLRLEAGYQPAIDYDDSNLADLKDAVNAQCGGDVRLMLRITKSYKLVDFDQQVIYGPFRLSTRVIGGLRQLFSIRIKGTPTPAGIVNLDDLRGWDGNIFDLEESTIVTAVTLKQQRLIPWTTDEAKQPETDSVVVRDWPFNTIENSDDDMPVGLDASGHEAAIGDVPGTIMVHDADPALIVPLPFQQYLASLANEIFDLFGRGAAEADLYCLQGVDAQVGDQRLLDQPHRPNAITTQTPTSQRGGQRRILVLHRTEEPEGPVLRVMDAVLQDDEEVGVGGGSEDETDPTGITPTDPIAFAGVSLGVGTAAANWADSYPQFSVLTQWEGHPPSDSTFNEFYDGEHSLVPNTFSDRQTGIGTGWTVRMRYRLTNGIANSNFSGWSNEVDVDGAAPATPVDVPDALVATSTVTDTAHGAWTNPDDTTDRIRIRWQASVEPSSPTVFANVAGGNRLLAANTTSDDQPTGAGTFARFTVEYVNSAGVSGPRSDYSSVVAITP
jgi:hypothetical protein